MKAPLKRAQEKLATTSKQDKREISKATALSLFSGRPDISSRGNGERHAEFCGACPGKKLTKVRNILRTLPCASHFQPYLQLSFCHFLKQRWGMSISSGYNMMAAAQVVENVQPVGQTIDLRRPVEVHRLLKMCARAHKCINSDVSMVL